VAVAGGAGRVVAVGTAVGGATVDAGWPGSVGAIVGAMVGATVGAMVGAIVAAGDDVAVGSLLLQAAITSPTARSSGKSRLTGFRISASYKLIHPNKT
jgi:hypothetical protein